MASDLVERATSEVPCGPDWRLNIGLSDIVNDEPRQAKNVLKAVKKRLGNKNPKIQMRTLELLETLIKNTGDKIQSQVIERGVLDELVMMVKKKPDLEVQEKILLLLDEFRKSCGGSKRKCRRYHKAYQDSYEIATSNVMKLPVGPSNGPKAMDKPCTSKPPTLEDSIKHFEAEKNEWGGIDAVINVMGELLKAKEASGTGMVPSYLESYIECGYIFLEVIHENTESISDKDNIFSAEVTKVISGMLQGLGKFHWTLGVLTVVGYVLHKIEEVSDNKRECLELLGSMIDVARHVKNLANHNLSQDEEEKLCKVMLTIIQGTMICASLLQKGFFKRFFRSSVYSETLKTVRRNIKGLYLDLLLTVIIKLKHVYLFAPQPPFPKNAVGIENPRKEVEQLLDMKRKKLRSVVIHGAEGIGKSTLGVAVVACLNLKDFNYAQIEIDEKPSNDSLKTLQVQLLRCAFPDYIPGTQIELADCRAGRHHLEQAIKGAKKPVFIFIENVLSEKYLSNLLPENLSDLPPHSRILLTTRDLNATDWLKERALLRKEYPVKTLCHEDGKRILCEDPKKLGHIEKEVKRILKFCGGNPLVLKIVADHLRKKGYTAENCNSI
uniref:VHS domain-containing protein n=1 Tax=Araucaria cunninghamii TaxID=56994 RepID=A0A0D6QVL5_ARACU